MLPLAWIVVLAACRLPPRFTRPEGPTPHRPAPVTPAYPAPGPVAPPIDAEPDAPSSTAASEPAPAADPAPSKPAPTQSTPTEPALAEPTPESARPVEPAPMRDSPPPPTTNGPGEPAHREPAPEADDPPEVPRHLPLRLPLAFQVRVRRPEGSEAMPASLEDLLVEEDRVVALVVSLATPGGDLRRLVAVDELRWLRTTEGYELGLESAIPPPIAGAELAALFADHEPARIQGRLVGPPDGDLHGAIYRLHDARNLVHRVLVEPGVLVQRERSGLEPGTTLVAEGVETRDEGGKLLVASAFGRAESMLTLRDPRGAILWDRLMDSVLSLREVVEVADLRSYDGVALDVRGVILDGETNRVSLWVGFDGEERVVPLPVLASAPDGGWGVLLERPGLLGLEEPPGL